MIQPTKTKKSHPQTMATTGKNLVFIDPAVSDYQTLVDGNALSITNASTPTNGSVALNNNTITFTPNTNFSGSGSFQYTLSDGQLTTQQP